MLLMCLNCFYHIKKIGIRQPTENGINELKDQNIYSDNGDEIEFKC